MHNSSGQWNHKILVSLIILVFGCSTERSNENRTEIPKEVILDIQVDTITTLSARKLELTREYCEKNYGFNDYLLDSPKMIVIHHTVIPTLKQTIALFKQNELAANRTFINRFSLLNVGIHYVIDRDGSIYNLLPDTIIARHIIGFNHVSIGIENVAATKNDLTQEQLKSNVELVKTLKSIHPTIEYMIGHDEYNKRHLAHYKLFKSLDKDYQPYDKPDPGVEFMIDLRHLLLEKYNLEFLD